MQNIEYDEITQKQTRPGKKIKINSKSKINKNIINEMGIKNFL